ncbi:MAG: hypothetical protein NVS1B1_14950 [Candidatus Limnocylindrales bacterium]
MLGQLERGERVLIADLEAGITNLNRMAPGAVDLVLIVVEATPKSIEVAQRAAAIAAERQVGPVRFVANKLRGPEDLAMLRGALGYEVVQVPEDPGVHEADRDGVALLDHAPDCPAVRAIAGLAAELLPAHAA